MPVIRASEIGSYLYCRRAWRYRKLGVESENKSELAAGTELHRQHGRKALSVGLFRTFGMILLLGAILLLVAYCTVQLSNVP
jgi:CRISPR/Cas system-associated exonuclease Cas4 (RecB family)